MCRGGGGHKWKAVKVLREPRLPLCPPKQTQLESQNQTQSETERSCRAVVVANSAWSMHRDGTTQTVQVVPKVAAGNTVAVLHKCPSPSPNPSCSSSCSGQSAPLATRILSPLPCPPPPPLWPVIICVPFACCCGGCLFN